MEASSIVWQIWSFIRLEMTFGVEIIGVDQLREQHKLAK
jgi:hypothetical protein